mmetsp:Transcript_23922/g.49863  ORF Transcript_23922/g.49863 Transcript_23922/m.49863 type:complete len:251 (-) Transcript_23922:2198-2950(-)
MSSIAFCTTVKALLSFPKKLLFASEHNLLRMTAQLAIIGWLSVLMRKRDSPVMLKLTSGEYTYDCMLVTATSNCLGVKNLLTKGRDAVSPGLMYFAVPPSMSSKVTHWLPIGFALSGLSSCVSFRIGRTSAGHAALLLASASHWIKLAWARSIHSPKCVNAPEAGEELMTVITFPTPKPHLVLSLFLVKKPTAFMATSLKSKVMSVFAFALVLVEFSSRSFTSSASCPPVPPSELEWVRCFLFTTPRFVS